MSAFRHLYQIGSGLCAGSVLGAMLKVDPFAALVFGTGCALFFIGHFGADYLSTKP